MSESTPIVADAPVVADIPVVADVVMAETVEENSKKRTEPDTATEGEEPAAKRVKTAEVDSLSPLREQLEYYFGEANYPTDKWMNLTASENDGFIPLASFSNFPRVAKLLEGQASDFIVQAIKNSEELELNADETKVKRKVPLPEETDLDPRSVFVSKLPQDAAGVTIDSVKNFFNAFAPVLSVKLHKQRSDKSIPIGTAYVAFKTAEDKDKVLALPEIKWGENALKVLDKAAADAAYSEKAKRGEEKKSKSEEGPSAPAWERGLIVKITNFGGSQLDDLKTKFNEFGVVKFVDIPSQIRAEPSADAASSSEAAPAPAASPVAYVRFAEADKAAAALAALEKKEVVFGESTVEGSLLAGDEEEEYWVKNIINGKPAGKKGGRGGGRGGRRGGGRGGRK